MPVEPPHSPPLNDLDLADCSPLSNAGRPDGESLTTATSRDERIGPPVGLGIGRTKRWAAVGAIAALLVASWWLGPQMSLARWADREQAVRAWFAAAPVATVAGAAIVYVAVTGASLPGAAPLTLVYGWLFGFWIALPLVSCSSTAGATLAMLASRFLFRAAAERRFAGRLSGVHAALASEGPFYLFTLRLIPAAPFFAVNALMGLVPIRVRTYWWVSQVGMLPGTALYVYAGSSVPSLRLLADEGLAAVFAPGQITRLTVALVLLGLFPWLARAGVKRLSKRWSATGSKPR